jgi:hypothetical protein
LLLVLQAESIKIMAKLLLGRNSRENLSIFPLSWVVSDFSVFQALKVWVSPSRRVVIMAFSLDIGADVGQANRIMYFDAIFIIFEVWTTL